MAEGIVLLVCYHLLLFRAFYFSNPYVYARSEALEQGFASSVHLGRALRARRWPPTDPYYFPDYCALPYLSTFYPLHLLQAWLGSFLSLNQAWILYATTMVLHFLVASLALLTLLQATGLSVVASTFGAVTLSSLGYAMKQNSCIVYTLAWVPLFLLAGIQHGTYLFGISLGLMLLAGYWPIALYTIPLGCWLWLLT